MNHKISSRKKPRKSTVSGSEEMQELLSTQPKITSFFQKFDPNNSNNPIPIPRRKRRRKSCLVAGPSDGKNPPEEITLSSDSDHDISKSKTSSSYKSLKHRIQVGAGFTIKSSNHESELVEVISIDGEGGHKEVMSANVTNNIRDNGGVEKSPLEKQCHRFMPAAMTDAEEETEFDDSDSTTAPENNALKDSECNAGEMIGTISKHTDPSNKKLKLLSTSELKDKEELTHLNVTDASLQERKSDKLENELVSFALPKSKLKTVFQVPFNEADTQLLTEVEEFTTEGNEFFAKLDVEEIINSASPSPVKSRSGLSPVEVGLSPNISPLLAKSSPKKISPQKVSYLSPVRHLKKDPKKRLFADPVEIPQSPIVDPYSLLKTVGASSSKSSVSSSTLVSSDSPVKNKIEFVENFTTIVDTVMQDCDYMRLFSDEDFSMYRNFLNLTLQAKCLYIRIFQRTLTWYRQSKVTYDKIASDLSPFFQELHRHNFFSEVKDILPLPDLHILLDMLDKDEMNNLSKTMNLNKKCVNSKVASKSELLKLVKSQRTLSKISSHQIVTDAVLQQLGNTFRVSEPSRDFFSRIFILYSLPQYWEDEDHLASNQLLTMLLTKLGKMEYPNYRICKQRNIYRNREDIFLFYKGLALHSQMQASILSKNWEDALVLLEEALERLKTLILPNEMVLDHDRNLPSFLRIYTAGSVLTRAAWLGVEGHQKLKQYEKANEAIDFLLNQASTSYLKHYRGRWHERKIINSKHLKQSNSLMKNYIIQGLSDSGVRDDHRLGLTARLSKLQNEEGKPKKRPTRNKVKTRKRVVSSSEESEEGECVLDSIDDANSALKTFKLKNPIPERVIGAEQLNIGGFGERVFGKSTFLGNSNQEGGIASSVEGRAIMHYRELGYPSGIHGEGAVPIALYGLLFWDIIYMDENISDVFRGPFQAFPLDLHFEDFYTQRRERIEEMLHNLRSSWSLADANAVIERNWNNNYEKLSIVVWSVFSSVEQVKSLVMSIGLALLADICERFARNFRHYRSGFPDLVVWKDKECIFVEVKGPGDTLSSKQSIWLDYLISAGAKAEVCRVKSVSNKRIRK